MQTSEDVVAMRDARLDDPTEFAVPDPPVRLTRPIENKVRLVRRNERCPCGSGKKFKTCHRAEVGARPAGERE